METLLRLPQTPALLEALVQIAQQTGDVARDLPPAIMETLRKACESSPQSAALRRDLAGEQSLASSSRMFGEDLPAGIVLASQS